MRVSEVNEQTRPELFYLPRDTGEVDGEGNPIIVYDVNEEEETVTTGLKIVRAGINGNLKKVHIDNDTVHIYRNDTRLCRYRIYVERWVDPDWVDVQVPFDTFTRNSEWLVGHIDRPAATGRMRVDTKTGKWQFQLTATGFLIRVRWVILWESADNIPDARIRVDDYPGEVEYNEPDGLMQTIIFEPDGINDYITIGTHYFQTITDTLTLSDSLVTVP